MALIATFSYRWNSKALIRTLGAYDYEFFAHWHLDPILQKLVVGLWAVRLLFPDWQPTISDDEVKDLKIDLASIGGNASASGSWLPATSDLGGGSNSTDGQNEDDDMDDDDDDDLDGDVDDT